MKKIQTILMSIITLPFIIGYSLSQGLLLAFITYWVLIKSSNAKTHKEQDKIRKTHKKIIIQNFHKDIFEEG